MVGLLMEYLPEHIYNGEAHVQSLQDAIAQVFDKLMADRDDLYLQFRQSTATWGLKRFEREYGLKVDETKPLDQRLSYLRAKRQGQGTVSAAMLKALAESFVGGEVEVRDYPEESRFEFIFVGHIGIPPNIEDLTAVIEEIKPAHLAFSYVMIYNTYKYLNQFAYGQLIRYTYQDLRDKEIVITIPESSGHTLLNNFTNGQLAHYTHQQLNMEVIQ